MNLPLKNNALAQDKFNFFAQIKTDIDVQTVISDLDSKTTQKDYSFLLNNKSALESEFNQIFSKLSKERDQDDQVFWFYCYYCASMLETFYKAYNQESQKKEYEALKLKIKEFLAKQDSAAEEQERFIDFLKKSFLNGFRRLMNSPKHIAEVRNHVVYANICRIQWIFTRLTLTKGLEVARDLHLIEQLDALLGTHTNVDKIITALQAPTAVLNYFSVGLFLARFLIDAALLIKHTFFPSELEKAVQTSVEVHQLQVMPTTGQLESYRNSYILIKGKAQGNSLLYYISKNGNIELIPQHTGLVEKVSTNAVMRLDAADITRLTGHTPETTTRMERFKHELYKRHCNFANDLVWATVNFLCNFNHITKITGPVTGYLTAAFLLFDTAMFKHKRRLAKKEYFAKKAQYEQEKKIYADLNQMKDLNEKQRLMHINMLDHQIKELEIDWKKKESTFYFCAAAASLLVLGFSASMVFNPALLVVASYFVCTVGVAMYLSAGSYSQYKEKSLYLEQAELSGENLPAAKKEYELARHDFIFKMVKNTVMPTLLIATCALYWPAAIILTAMYLGFELFHAYSQHSGHQEAKALACLGK